jgi:uncharacterized membrane protein YtjA (UPF0391 family)
MPKASCFDRTTARRRLGSADVYSPGRREPNFCADIIRAGNTMLNLVVALLIIGLIAAVLGFGGIAGASFPMAKVIFFIVLVLFLLSIVFGAVRRPLL